MSLVQEPDDLVSCEISEKNSSKGQLSSIYLIDIKFKVNSSSNVLPLFYIAETGLSVQILMSLVKEPDDLVSCEIAEKKTSKDRLSSTYLID